MNKKGQQEIVGFALIVVIVVIALMVFLVLSIGNDKSTNTESIIAKNMIYSILNYQTACAIRSEPNYDSVEDLIKSCYENDICSNLNKDACEVMVELLPDIMEKLILTESQYDNYDLKIYFIDDSENRENILNLQEGNLTGRTIGADHAIIGGGEGNIRFEILLYEG